MAVGNRREEAWEYLTILEAEHGRLAALGGEGWELVAIGGEPRAQRLFLKRRIADFQDRVTNEQRARYYRAIGLDPDAADGQRP
jgi:hypothetical protein